MNVYGFYSDGAPICSVCAGQREGCISGSAHLLGGHLSWAYLEVREIATQEAVFLCGECSRAASEAVGAALEQRVGRRTG